MKVLLIDDNPAERKKAVEAAQAKGWEVVVCDSSSRYWINAVDNVDGVVTDLMWDYSEHGKKPMGLMVVIHALYKGKPVVICTDAVEGGPEGHHSEAISFIFDGYLNATRAWCYGDCKLPFGWEEGKDWTKAMEKLAKQMEP